VKKLNYVVFDLEYNQQDRENNRLAWTMRTRKPKYLKAEILQIGAIKVDENLKYVSNFKMYVRPKFLPKVSEHVLNLLGVSENYIKINGLYFNKVFSEFERFIGQDECTFVTWSGCGNDINVLSNNLRVWGIKFNINNFRHIDLQQVIMKKHNLKQQLSLEKTAIEYGINFNNSQLHDAYTDASITRELLKRIGINEVETYAKEIEILKKKNSVRPVKNFSFKRRSILNRELKRVPHCNMCGRFVKTIIKTDLYTCNTNNSIIRMTRICNCDKCNIYIFKDYEYVTIESSLSIKDNIVHKNNSQNINSIKNNFGFIEGIDDIQF
jgi:DNA polymerase III epsilon subunit-like protein